MTKPVWITTSPTSGTGNGTSSITAPAYTGRKQRTGVITVTTNGGQTATVAVTQSALAAFVTAGGNQSILATATTATVTFTSNVQAFKVTPTGGASITSVKANGTAITASGGVYTPSGDPGGSAQYTVEIAVSVPANTTITAKTFTVKLEHSTTASISGTVTINQSAGSSSISVSPTSLTFAAGGETKTINITSNDSWTIS